MVDSVLLLVDALTVRCHRPLRAEKSLDLALNRLLSLNKIDRPGSRPEEVVDMVFDLFCELNANEDQLDFPIVYASAKLGIAKRELEDESDNLEPLFQMIRERVDPPRADADAPFQMLVTNIDYNKFIGRTATGKILTVASKLERPWLVSIVKAR